MTKLGSCHRLCCAFHVHIRRIARIEEALRIVEPGYSQTAFREDSHFLLPLSFLLHLPLTTAPPPIITMASLNTSSNGPNITRSYQNVVNAPPPSGTQASSPTYGQWAVFAVAAPLVSAFQGDGGKESVLKVQSTGGMSTGQHQPRPRNARSNRLPASDLVMASRR